MIFYMYYSLLLVNFWRSSINFFKQTTLSLRNTYDTSKNLFVVTFTPITSRGTDIIHVSIQNLIILCQILKLDCETQLVDKRPALNNWKLQFY